eukprot:211910-Prorocentrum_minimum.AAC.2
MHRPMPEQGLEESGPAGQTFTSGQSAAQAAAVSPASHTWLPHTGTRATGPTASSATPLLPLFFAAVSCAEMASAVIAGAAAVTFSESV